MASRHPNAQSIFRSRRMRRGRPLRWGNPNPPLGEAKPLVGGERRPRRGRTGIPMPRAHYPPRRMVTLPIGARSAYLQAKGSATFPQKVRLPFAQKSAYLSAKGQTTLMGTLRLAGNFSVSADFVFGTATFEFGTDNLLLKLLILLHKLLSRLASHRCRFANM